MTGRTLILTCVTAVASNHSV